PCGDGVARFRHHREQRTRHRGAVPEARRTAAGHRAGGSPCSCFLSRGAASSPPGALRWSYELLDDAERLLLERCSVFPAEFDYDTAAEIAGFPPLQRADLTRLFPRVLDRSLISASRRGQFTAYRMLESIRDFARSQLALRGEEEQVRERHASYHLGHGPKLLAALQGGDQAAAMSWFDRRWADLRAAMQWALDRRDIDLAWRFVAGVGTGWEILGMRGQLFDWLEVMLKEPLPTG